VRAAEKFTDANTRFITGDSGEDQFAAGFAQVLGASQHRREHHCCRVQDRAVVQVILLHQV